MQYQDYKKQKKMWEERLASLIVPGMDAVAEADRLFEELPELWKNANLGERRRILMTMLDSVYVECREERRIVAIKPKPAFRLLYVRSTMSGTSWASRQLRNRSKTKRYSKSFGKSEWTMPRVPALAFHRQSSNRAA